MPLAGDLWRGRRQRLFRFVPATRVLQHSDAAQFNSKLHRTALEADQTPTLNE
jgi:hypothetical protein